jgi:DNA-binding response OmpR family regulator
MDKHQQTATFMGESVELTTTEYNLLWCLVDHSPEPVSPRQLILEAMGYDSEEYEAREIIKFHIHKLRQKLEPRPNKPRYIKTIRYKGYAWAGQ